MSAADVPRGARRSGTRGAEELADVVTREEIDDRIRKVRPVESLNPGSPSGVTTSRPTPYLTWVSRLLRRDE